MILVKPFTVLHFVYCTFITCLFTESLLCIPIYGNLGVKIIKKKAQYMPFMANSNTKLSHPINSIQSSISCHARKVEYRLVSFISRTIELGLPKSEIITPPISLRNQYMLPTEPNSFGSLEAWYPFLSSSSLPKLLKQ